ncbi:MAG: DNA adenine methylase [Succinivibrio sp.]|jgi:DNA adenine methylase|nr:DNA adenine methylase [Succinivibrio sp.]
MHTPNNIEHLKPFVKWVGGKSTSLLRLLEYIPSNIENYVEPFLGSGALFFALNFKKAIINDSNEELILAYKVIKEQCPELIMYLQSLIYDKELYEKIRAWDREPDFKQRSDLERAARLIYLIKTCYNGLYRVSKKNQFNTPFGNHKDPNICDVRTLLACSEYLNKTQAVIMNKDYEALLDDIPEDAFVYLDPPYFPVSKTANFTSYQSGKFNFSEQERLYNFCVKLHERGIRFMQSNSDTEDVRAIYKRFDIKVVEVSRRVNSNTQKRSAVNEVVITNYDPDTGIIKSL